MPPLMYQFTGVTCWYVSMINGIMLLRWRHTKDFEESLLKPMEDRLLRSLTAQYTEFSSRPWWTLEEYRYYESVMNCVAEIAKLEIHVYRGKSAGKKIRELKFESEVAICNTCKGTHAILLHERKKDGINCFDPWWDYVKKSEKSKGYQVFPNASPTNLWVRCNYFLEEEKEPFTIGNSHQFLTVLQRSPSR